MHNMVKIQLKGKSLIYILMFMHIYLINSEIQKCLFYYI
jgi:hypothetical protein